MLYKIYLLFLSTKISLGYALLVSLKLKKGFLFLLCFIHFLFGVVWFSQNSYYRYLYGFVGLIYSFIFFICAYFLGRKYWAFWLAIFLILLSILASFFDQIGWVDAAYIMLTVFIFVILIKGKL
ncbi:MAG: hypothetical protein KatS3mg088_323 [Patescibacteria group bacterium]|nr:MAG: hypothetical protein KatS3mg088_323 [Patescibacteria group bacterium]